MISTHEDAIDAPRSALADVDSAAGAKLALGRVATRFRPTAATSWEAFRFGSEQLLDPWFKDETEAVVWEEVEVYFGCVAEDRDPGPRVRCMADVPPEDVTWLWGSRIPRGKLTAIVGDPGVGKSWLTTEIVACVTTGRPLPGDEFGGEYEPINVLLLNAEDGAGDTIRPRLDRAGADVERVHIFDGVERPDGGLDPFDLRDPIQRSYLAGLIEDLDIGPLMIDPLTAYLGVVDSHRDADTRGVLAPLAELAESSACAVLTIRHLNNGSTSRAIYRAGGSIGLIAAVRSSMLVGQIDEESDERALVTIKLNLAAFPPPVGSSLAGGRFGWTAKPDVAASDLLGPEADSDERSDRKDVVTWWCDVLKSGPVSSLELFERAKGELSVSERTVKRARYVLSDAISVYRVLHEG